MPGSPHTPALLIQYPSARNPELENRCKGIAELIFEAAVLHSLGEEAADSKNGVVMIKANIVSHRSHAGCILLIEASTLIQNIDANSTVKLIHHRRQEELTAVAGEGPSSLLHTARNVREQVALRGGDFEMLERNTMEDNTALTRYQL